MAQIKSKVRSLEDIEDSLSSSPKEIDDNLQGRNPDEEITETAQTDDSQPTRTFYRSPSEDEEQNKPAESEEPETDEDPLESAEGEPEPKPEPEEHLEEPEREEKVGHDGKADEMVEKYAESKDFKEGIYPEAKETEGKKQEEMSSQVVPTRENTLDDLAGEETSEEERTDRQQIDNTDSHEDLHIPNLRQNPSQKSFSSNAPPIPASDHSFASRYADRPKNSSKLPLVFLAIIGIGVLGTSVYLLKGQLRSFKNVLGINAVVPSPSPQASPSPSPSPTPTPVPDRSKFKVRVLNGTTKTGLAASESAKLKDLGYQIDKTGNAPTQDYKTTQVKVKSAAQELGDQLVKDLAPYFTASSSGTLKDSDIDDGEVTLGAK